MREHPATGGAIYRRRKCTVEPVFGQAEEARGFRRFRGWQKSPSGVGHAVERQRRGSLERACEQPVGPHRERVRGAGPCPTFDARTRPFRPAKAPLGRLFRRESERLGYQFQGELGSTERVVWQTELSLGDPASKVYRHVDPQRVVANIARRLHAPARVHTPAVLANVGDEGRLRGSPRRLTTECSCPDVSNKDPSHARALLAYRPKVDSLPGPLKQRPIFQRDCNVADATIRAGWVRIRVLGRRVATL